MKILGCSLLVIFFLLSYSGKEVFASEMDLLKESLISLDASKSKKSQEKAEQDNSMFNIASLPSVFTASFLGDDADSNSNQFFLDYGLKSYNRFQLGMGSSRSLEDDGPFYTYNFLIAYNTDPLEIWSHNFNYNYWGKVNKFELAGIQYTLTYDGESFTAYISPELKSVGVNINIPSGQFVDKYKGSSLGFGAGYSGLKNWSFNFDFRGYDYDRIEDLDEFPLIYTTININDPRFLNLANGLMKSQSSLSVSYGAGKLYTSLEFSNGITAIEEIKSQTTALNFNYKFTKMFAAGLSLGSTLADVTQPDADRLKFASLNLSFEWE